MLNVRVMAESDVPVLVAAFPEGGAAPANRHAERLVRQQSGEITCLVAWDDQIPVGYVFLRWPGSSGATVQGRSLGCVELGDLSVVASARRRGAGRMLLEAAEALAAERGHDLIGLEVATSNPFNEAARALYERLGYRDAGLDTFTSGYTYWDAGGRPHRDEEPHLYMTKRLRS
jgi:GNAT superfamily N-acetyltransferase